MEPDPDSAIACPAGDGVVGRARRRRRPGHQCGLASRRSCHAAVAYRSGADAWLPVHTASADAVQPWPGCRSGLTRGRMPSVAATRCRRVRSPVGNRRSAIGQLDAVSIDLRARHRTATLAAAGDDIGHAVTGLPARRLTADRPVCDLGPACVQASTFRLADAVICEDICTMLETLWQQQSNPCATAASPSGTTPQE